MASLSNTAVIDKKNITFSHNFRDASNNNTLTVDLNTIVPFKADCGVIKQVATSLDLGGLIEVDTKYDPLSLGPDMTLENAAKTLTKTISTNITGAKGLDTFTETDPFEYIITVTDIFNNNMLFGIVSTDWTVTTSVTTADHYISLNSANGVLNHNSSSPPSDGLQITDPFVAGDKFKVVIVDGGLTFFKFNDSNLQFQELNFAPVTLEADTYTLFTSDNSTQNSRFQVELSSFRLTEPEIMIYLTSDSLPQDNQVFTPNGTGTEDVSGIMFYFAYAAPESTLFFGQDEVYVLSGPYASTGIMTFKFEQLQATEDGYIKKNELNKGIISWTIEFQKLINIL